MTGVVVLAAGGTGGHLFPAAALGGELMIRGWGVVLLTDRRGAKSAQQAMAASISTHVVRSASPAGRNLLTLGWVFLQIVLGTWQAWWLLARLRPAAVVGFGGYPTVPTLWAAIQRRVPTLIHEQNAVLGRVNRTLARRVDCIALSHRQTARVPGATEAKIVVTGNPVRAALHAIRAMDYVGAEPTGRFGVLVIGGSQGTGIFADVVPHALAALPLAQRQRLEVVQQCRAEDLDRVAKIYQASGIASTLRTFFEDIGDQFSHAHLVVSRAGASSISELGCVGRPAILIPLPHAADDHQTVNAKQYARDGAAIVLAQGTQFTAESLSALLGDLMTTPARLIRMAAAARVNGRTDCASVLADATERLARGNGAASEGQGQ